MQSELTVGEGLDLDRGGTVRGLGARVELERIGRKAVGEDPSVGKIEGGTGGEGDPVGRATRAKLVCAPRVRSTSG